MNLNADALSRNPIASEEKSRNLHEDDDTFMTSQEKGNLEKTFSKINQGNNIKKGNNSKSKYFNSIFAQDDTDDLSESSQDPILNINPKFMFMTIILLSPILGKNYENSPWKTVTTRGKKKKQEQMKNLNQHKSLENLSRNKPFEPPIKKLRGRPRKNVLTDSKNTPSETKRKTGRPRKQIIEDELSEIYTKKPSRVELGSDSDSGPEYLDYLKEIQVKNGKKWQKA